VSNRDNEWQLLYVNLVRALKRLGIEDPYGEGDYWLVDDDYGDTTQKLCVHRRSFIQPELITLLQRELREFPHWRVMMQIEFPLDNPTPRHGGLIVHHDRIEEHWDRNALKDVAARLNL
jgi:hypothetical protein